MVNSFDEEVKALEEYGHDCCARIDDRIHECCQRIREAHEQKLDDMRTTLEVALLWKDEQQGVTTYDALGNERHKAVCELRKLKCKSGLNGSFVCELASVLNVPKDDAPYEDAVLHGLIRDRLIHLLGGDQTTATLKDLHGIWKESGDGVDAGGRDEAGSRGAVPAADGRVADCDCGLLSEGVAPITTELRDAMSRYCNFVNENVVSLAEEEFDRLCDAIDAVHANLERENAELRKRTMYPAKTERVNMLEREVKRLTSECKTQRNNFDQATSAREHWKQLYEQSLEHIRDLEHERHEWAPESHYMMLPKDSDGIPVHIGDVMEWPDTSTAEVVGVYENGFFYVEGDDDVLADWTTAHDKIHHKQATVEGILREFALCVAGKECMSMRKGVVEEFAKRLTLAGDAE